MYCHNINARTRTHWTRVYDKKRMKCFWLKTPNARAWNVSVDMLGNGPTSTKMSQSVTNTVIDPGTVVVHFHYASFAHTTVVRWTGLVRVAPRTWQRGIFYSTTLLNLKLQRALRNQLQTLLTHQWQLPNSGSVSSIVRGGWASGGTDPGSVSMVFKCGRKCKQNTTVWTFCVAWFCGDWVPKKKVGEAKWTVTLTWHHSDIHHSAWKKPRIIKPTIPKLVLYICSMQCACRWACKWKWFEDRKRTYPNHSRTSTNVTVKLENIIRDQLKHAPNSPPLVGKRRIRFNGELGTHTHTHTHNKRVVENDKEWTNPSQLIHNVASWWVPQWAAHVKPCGRGFACLYWYGEFVELPPEDTRFCAMNRTTQRLLQILLFAHRTGVSPLV
jgi:hypothetical protein